VAVRSVTNKYVWARIVPPEQRCYGACILAVSAGLPDARIMRVGVDYNVEV
jgi:hypothetical protein